jgi:hypothetical protein
MGRYAADTGGDDFVQASAGSHIARSIRIVDIGTHHDQYEGKQIKRNQFVLQWELPDETMEIDGKSLPVIVSRFYTNSLSKKSNLRKDLESWRSKQFTAEELMSFDLMQILNKPCMLSIVKNDNGKSVVKTVSPCPKGVVCPPAVNKVEAFWLDEWDDNKFAALSDGFKKLIVQSEEYKAFEGEPALPIPKKAQGIEEDDIPFN